MNELKIIIFLIVQFSQPNTNKCKNRKYWLLVSCQNSKFEEQPKGIKKKQIINGGGVKQVSKNRRDRRLVGLGFQ